MNKSVTVNPIIIGLKWAEISQINTIAQGVDVFHRIVTLKTGQNYNQLYFTPGSANFDSTEKLDDPGEVHQNTLQYKYPGDGINVPGEIAIIQNKRGVIVFTYNDGSVRTFGTVDNPVICSASFSGKDKGYNITFDHKSTKGSFLI